MDAAGPARDTELMPRGLLALVVLVSVLGAAEAGLARPAKWPPPHCPTARALVAYYVSDGFTFNDDLVVRRDGHASLCWGRHIGNRSGRRDFALPLAKIVKYLLALGLAEALHNYLLGSLSGDSAKVLRGDLYLKNVTHFEIRVIAPSFGNRDFRVRIFYFLDHVFEHVDPEGRLARVNLDLDITADGIMPAVGVYECGLDCFQKDFQRDILFTLNLSKRVNKIGVHCISSLKKQQKEWAGKPTLCTTPIKNPVHYSMENGRLALGGDGLL